MAILKRLLLFAAVGTVSIVLADCYGIPARQGDWIHRSPQPDQWNREPVPKLETFPAPLAK